MRITAIETIQLGEFPNLCFDDRPEDGPGKLAGPKEESRPDGRDQDIEHERGGLHHLRRDPVEGHRREISLRAGMTDRGIERGGHENQARQDQYFGQRHPYHSSSAVTGTPSALASFRSVSMPWFVFCPASIAEMYPCATFDLWAKRS
jgi:hypothetical protein